MNIKAIVLAGGQGTRFFPFQQNKTIFPFFSKPLVTHQVDKLIMAGFDSITLVTSLETHDTLVNFYKDESRVQCVQQAHSNPGMAGAVLSALDQEEAIFVVNALDFVDQSLLKQCYQQAAGETSFIVGKKMSQYFDGGYVSLDGERLTQIVEKPGKGNEPSDLVNLVFHFFADAQKFKKYLTEAHTDRDDVYEQALDAYAKSTLVRVIEYDNDWYPVKYGHHLIDLTHYLLTSQLKPAHHAAYIADSARVDESVYLGKGVKVYDGAVIRGPSYIGDNTVVGNNALVVHSIIESDCVVGYNSEVTRSYLGANTWLHTNYVGDSILEKNISFGCRVTTANFRLDQSVISCAFPDGQRIATAKTKFGTLMGADVRLGIQSSTMPGVMIGSGCRVGPGTIVQKSLAPDTTTYVSQEQVIKKH